MEDKSQKIGLPSEQMSLGQKTTSIIPELTTMIKRGSLIITVIFLLGAALAGYVIGAQNSKPVYENTTYLVAPGQAYQNLKTGITVMCQKNCQQFRICDQNNTCQDSACNDWPSDTASKLINASLPGTYVQSRPCTC